MIGKKLGLAYVLERSVRKGNEKIRITAQIIQASDGSQVWSRTYDRTMEDIFKVQDEISKAVVDQLKICLTDKSVEHASPVNSAAYNLYL